MSIFRKNRILILGVLLSIFAGSSSFLLNYGGEVSKPNLAHLEDKVSILDKLIKEAEGNGIDMAYQRVTSAVAKEFIKYIPGDAVRKAGDFPENFSDFRIIGSSYEKFRI